MRRVVCLTAILFLLTSVSVSEAQRSMGWEITGGSAWEERVGPGLMLAIGGNDCTDDYCDDYHRTNFLGSIAGTVGFFYRIIPNVAVFVDLHTGYVNSHWPDINNDHGFLFQTIGGGEFHVPITGWVDAYVGFGMGFAYLGFWGEHRRSDADIHRSLKGVDFELRTGSDFYPFSRVPTRGVGPFFRLGMVYWASACLEDDARNYDECDSPDDLGNVFDNDLPFLVLFGAAIKYGF